MEEFATLGKKDAFSVFSFRDKTIRFRAPYSLESYTDIKEWDHGYLVVMAKYRHSETPEEEYIDLIPILDELYIESNEFLKHIKGVKLENA